MPSRTGIDEKTSTTTEDIFFQVRLISRSERGSGRSPGRLAACVTPLLPRRQAIRCDSDPEPFDVQRYI
jgi:hypothetical protein